MIFDLILIPILIIIISQVGMLVGMQEGNHHKCMDLVCLIFKKHPLISPIFPRYLIPTKNERLQGTWGEGKVDLFPQTEIYLRRGVLH